VGWGAVSIVCVVLGVLASSCGGREREPGPAERAPNDAGRDASAGSQKPPRPSHDSGEPASDAGDGSAERPLGDASLDGATKGASDGSRDASVDSSLDAPFDAARDAVSDALLSPDCRCPPGDYFLDATVGSRTLHLTEPLELLLFCDETTVQLAHNDCGRIYRVSACAGPNSGPPCVYIAVDLDRGPLVGEYIDETGQTWLLRSGTIDPDPSNGRRATGTFSGTYTSEHGDASLVVQGNYAACANAFPPCEP